MKSYDYKTIKQVRLKNKRVLVRVDFNVPINSKGYISDDFRIKQTIPTIKYLLKKKARIILASHLGRPKFGKIQDYSLKPIAKHLAKLLKRKVKFIDDCIGKKVKLEILKMKSGEILMLENLRFYKGEEQNNPKFAKNLADLADIYVNDAFGVSHRKHASVHAITKFLPSYAGFLLDKEIKILDSAYSHPKRPFCVVIGGSKISTKIDLILRFFNKADNILIGGALANTLFVLKGYAVGKSKIEKIEKDLAYKIKKLNLASTKIHLPVDAVVAKEISEKAKTKIKGVGSIKNGEMILDIGPDTVKLFSDIIREAKMVIWNGPLGFFEVSKFSKGTAIFAKALIKTKAFTILGGGDIIAAVDKLRLLNKFTFVSTGGGAMLEFLSGKELPGIKALSRCYSRQFF